MQSYFLTGTLKSTTSRTRYEFSYTACDKVASQRLYIFFINSENIIISSLSKYTQKQSVHNSIMLSLVHKFTSQSLFKYSPLFLAPFLRFCYRRMWSVWRKLSDKDVYAHFRRYLAIYALSYIVYLLGEPPLSKGVRKVAWYAIIILSFYLLQKLICLPNAAFTRIIFWLGFLISSIATTELF